MASAKNLVMVALAVLVWIAEDSQASTYTVLETQQYYNNENCQGTPNFQGFDEYNQDVCFTDIVEPGPGNHVDVVDLATDKVVAINVNSYSFSCQRPAFSTGQNCEKHFHKTIGSYCFRYYNNNQFVYSIRFSCFPCRPVNTITKAHCNKIIQQCENLEIIEGSEVIPIPATMKWTGRGCRVDGQPVGDGGCQCDGYCGYTCERACNADSQCYWDTTSNQCFSAETNAPGQPIKFCPSHENVVTPQGKQPNGKFPWFRNP